MKTYAFLVLMYLRSIMEYRMTFIASCVANFIRKIAEYLGIWILLSAFHAVDTWSFYDVLILYNINQFAISFSGMIFWSPMNQLESYVHKGDLDTLLTKPIGLLSHLICRTFDVSFLANLTLSSLIFVYCFVSSDITWTFLKICILLVTIIGAILIYSSLHIFIGTLSFYVVKIGAIFSTIMDFRRFIFYPISIYHQFIQFMLTFIFPIAFVNYYPLLYLLDKTIDCSVPTFLYPIISIALGVFLLVVSCIFFNVSSRRYVSTGN